MKQTPKGPTFSASDLLGFMACGHYTTLGLLNLETPIEKAQDDEQAQLIQDKGDEHERDYLRALEQSGVSVANIPQKVSLEERVSATFSAMQSGADIVYQAAFSDGNLMGYADFLRRVETPSRLGNYSYEVIDTKLARSPKAKFAIQLCFYSRLLAKVQGIEPKYAYIVLGTREEVTLRLDDYRYYFEELLGRFLEHCQQRPATRPEPCNFCDLCPWRDHCHAQWEAEDHLSFVANIQRGQIDKLRAAGIDTLEQLATTSVDTAIPKLAKATWEQLHQQARLQYKARQEGKPLVEVLPLDPNGERGFYRMPEPSPADLFFDMEGDPLEVGGLEYLFGVYYFGDNGREQFKPFWAHTRREEKQAFEDFIDFVTAHLTKHPDAYIYHYAAYEQTALKKLMSLHGTREAEVDDLLRQGKLVDLYRIVREAIRVSEPSYSIKNLEVFYREAREGDVKNAGASIVYYERWRATREQRWLDDIEAYNRVDCESTYQLQQWLLGLLPDDITLHTGAATAGESPKSDNIKAHEEELAKYEAALVREDDDVDKKELHELTYQLLDFHRRNDKPAWWAMFSRRDMTDTELLDDAEAIAMATELPDHPREDIKKSEVVTYTFPDQEFKLKKGEYLINVHTLETAGEVVDLDLNTRIVRLKRAKSRGPLPEILSLGPGGPINSGVIAKALFRFADSVVAGDKKYMATKALLCKQAPSVQGIRKGAALVTEKDVSPETVADVVARMQNSYLFIQGPPGSGKTYTGSYVIVDLIRRGYRIGVTSNSHKAINNLLAGVEKWAKKLGVDFTGTKKARRQNPDSYFDGDFISSAETNDEAIIELASGGSLVAGTAWFISRSDMNSQLDYLFVDEAGQVALANLIAMATSAKNLVLLGDQMQLGQPIQGVHPGRSGESSLEYLLEGRATIPDDRGIFLPLTYRMHPDVTQFISDAIYDSRLHAAKETRRQKLVNKKGLPCNFKQPGIVVMEVESEGCSQHNEPEASAIREQYQALLGQSFVDRDGNRGTLSEENILVVAPYNMQVNLLKQTLGDKARVGTVDKFQGQEAEVVFISMATSSQEYLPRFIDFLFSRNRLNVAISRARILAVLAISPDLTKIECNTLEQMALVNTLCWVKKYAVRNSW